MIIDRPTKEFQHPLPDGGTITVSSVSIEVAEYLEQVFTRNPELIIAQSDEIARLRNALHKISLGAQSSMSSRDECGRIAREALATKT